MLSYIRSTTLLSNIIKGIIDKETLEFLTVKFPRLSTFYALPKTHKNIKKNPGRPIVSVNGNLTEQASQLVDRHLRPYVISLFSYTKDTIELLKQIEGLTVPPDAILVSLDVEALYCNIPHDIGIPVISSFLSESLPPGAGRGKGDHLCPILRVPVPGGMRAGGVLG